METTTPPSRCLGCDPETVRLRDRYSYVGDVLQAKEQGCSQCEVISWILESYMDGLLSLEFDVKIKFDRFLEALTVSGQRYSGDIDTNWNSNILELEVRGVIDTSNASFGCSQQSCPWAGRKLEAAPKISGFTGSVEAIDRAISWLKGCTDNHPVCEIKETPFLPSRVVEIVGVNQVRVHAPKDERALYACLSHRWGSAALIQTTTANIQEYSTSIPWEKLPQTFQDAITFTHGLGLKYLWIDSLCILQDSLEDWQNEGSKMSDIYVNSFVTLAATFSPDSLTGCFSHSDQKHISQSGTFLNENGIPYEIHYRVPLAHKAAQAPLQQRGWAFQERLLPMRVIHFMQEELVWECSTIDACECTFSYKWHKQKNDQENLDFSKRRRFHQMIAHPNRRTFIENCWYDIVGEYSRKNLTFPSDIFPALQGFAKLLSPTMGWYFAGHWERSLPRSLTWYIDGHGQRRPSEWRAPSWSWAAVMCPVRWPDAFAGLDSREYSDRFFVNLVSVRTAPTGTDPTGQLFSGELVLRGKCLIGEIFQGEHLAEIASDYGFYTAPRLFLRGRESRATGLWSVSPFWDTRDEPTSGVQVLVMKLMEMDAAILASYEESWLVLRSVDAQRQHFKRIGLLHQSYHKRDHEDSLRKQRFNDLFEQGGEELEVTIL